MLHDYGDITQKLRNKLIFVSPHFKHTNLLPILRDKIAPLQTGNDNSNEAKNDDDISQSESPVLNRNKRSAIL